MLQVESDIENPDNFGVFVHWDRQTAETYSS